MLIKKHFTGLRQNEISDDNLNLRKRGHDLCLRVRRTNTIRPLGAFRRRDPVDDGGLRNRVRPGQSLLVCPVPKSGD